MHNALLIISSLILAIVISACATTAKPVIHDAPPVDTTLMAYGIDVYLKNYCGSCHTLTAANTRGTFGPPHDNAGTAAAEHVHLADYTGTADNAADYIRESILEPTAFYTPGYEATNHHMPAFTHLPDEDIAALVYLLTHQRTTTN